MDTQRLIALIVFTFSGLMLWEAWNKHNRPPVLQPPAAHSQAAVLPQTTGTDKGLATVPTASVPLAAGVTATGAGASGGSAPLTGAPKSANRIQVKTDFLSVELDSQGGDIRNVTLLKHVAHGDSARAFSLMQDKVGAYFVAQSGLLGGGLLGGLLGGGRGFGNAGGMLGRILGGKRGF